MKVSSSCGSPAISVLVVATSAVAQLVVDVGVDEDALHADAALARLVEGAEDDALDRVVEVGVGVDDHRGVAAQLQHHLLLAGLGLQVPADAGRAGEAEQLQPLVGGEEVGAVALGGQDREGALGQVGLGQDLADDDARRSGCALAGFITNGQPTAIAGAILWAARFSGKLNGVMNEQGPIGTRFHMP